MDPGLVCEEKSYHELIALYFIAFYSDHEEEYNMFIIDACAFVSVTDDWYCPVLS